MKWLSSLFLLLCLPLAAAEAQPGLYRIVNVDSFDVLNVRETANPLSAILGTLAPDAEMIEVLEEEDGWGRILLDEGNGWVNMSYLAPMDRPMAGEFDAPGHFQCLGTEPFWGAQLGSDGRLSFHDGMSLGEELTAELTDAQTASARPDPHYYAFEGAVSGTLIIDAETCSDGMSDRDYGWRAYLFARDPEGGRRFVDGCCMTPLPN